MPIIKSAIKRDRQAHKRRAYNMSVKSCVRAKSKLARAQIEAKEISKSRDALIAAVAELDRAVKRGVLHKNHAARRKSQLTRSYNSIAKKAYGTETATKKPATKQAAKPATKTAGTGKTAAKSKAATKKPFTKK